MSDNDTNNDDNNTKPTYNEYCDDPEKYKERLNSLEIMLHDGYCNSKNADFYKLMEDGTMDFLKLGDKEIGPAIEKFLEGMLGTTTGRQMLALQFGIPPALNLLKSCIVKVMTQEYIDKIVKDITEIGIKETSNICMTILGSAIRGGIKLAIMAEEDVLGPVGWIMNAVQIFGMLIDMWDPCDLHQQLGPSMLNIFSNQFNHAFSSMQYSNIQPTQDVNKRITYKLDIWPEQFFIDNTYISDAVKKLKKEDYYDKKHSQYSAIYISNLNIPEIPNAKLITADHFKSLDNSNDIFYYIANKNTVVEKFLRNNWPYIILIIVLIIVLIFYFKKKNNK